MPFAGQLLTAEDDQIDVDNKQSSGTVGTPLCFVARIISRTRSPDGMRSFAHRRNHPTLRCSLSTAPRT